MSAANKTRSRSHKAVPLTSPVLLGPASLTPPLISIPFSSTFTLLLFSPHSPDPSTPLRTARQTRLSSSILSSHLLPLPLYLATPNTPLLSSTAPCPPLLSSYRKAACPRTPQGPYGTSRQAPTLAEVTAPASEEEIGFGFCCSRANKKNVQKPLSELCRSFLSLLGSVSLAAHDYEAASCLLWPRKGSWD